MIDFDIAAGAKTIMLTYGDSLCSVLSDEELGEVTKVVAEHTSGRAMVIAADRMWSTAKEVEFARYARNVGADMLMVLPPDWARSCTPQALSEHYAAVAKHIRVMIVTGYLIEWGMGPGLEVIKLVHDKVEGVVALIDDFCGEFMRRLCTITGDKWALISGGLKQNHLDAYPYGVDGYLSTFMTFKPSVTDKYWDAIRADDVRTAAQVVSRYEWPYFDFLGYRSGGALKGGFDAGIHGTMEVFGLAERWRRKPYYSLNDQEMELLADFFKREY